MRHQLVISSERLKPGQILAERVEKVWIEDFIDMDEDKIIPVERRDIIGYPFDEVTPEMIEEIKTKGIRQVKIYTR